MYGERYGVMVHYHSSAEIESTDWFFTLEEAQRHSKTDRGGAIVRGVLHNDEGCTPWIETVELITPADVIASRIMPGGAREELQPRM